MTKKVVIIIVEGPSDEYLLKKFLDERYTTQRLKFKVYGGDTFTSNRDSDQPIKNKIGNIIKQIMVYEKFKPRDILAVLQLTDMDGCMINNNKIVVKKTQLVPTFYNLENIIVNSNIQKENIIERNLIKKRKTLKMVNLKKICNDKYSYQIYYFSRNIELVFFDDLNPIQEEKVKNALKFSKHNSTVYLQIINKTSPPLKNITYEKKYEESWNFIKDEENSLKRYSNFSLLLEFLDSLI